MAVNRRKQDDKNILILRELTSTNGNKYCFDCNQRGPTYVNTTIGSFVCTKCSGMLRGLTPPHRVKSISMATFTSEEIAFIKSRGNDYCRRIWLGLFDGESINLKDEQSVKDFMSDKYEKKRYYLEPLPNSHRIENGPITNTSKIKSKATKSNSNGMSLISISPSTNRPAVPTSNTALINGLSTIAPAYVKVEMEPINNNVVQSVSQAPAPTVSEFPVDFSNANIYNSNQVSNSFADLHNNIPSFATFSSNPTVVDKYAALADLDLELKQQNNLQNTDNNASFTKNPFQGNASMDEFGNKNPFRNCVWEVDPKAVHANPFNGHSMSDSMSLRFQPDIKVVGECQKVSLTNLFQFNSYIVGVKL